MSIRYDSAPRPQLDDVLIAGQVVPTREVPIATTIGPAASGYLQLTCFTADKTESINTLTAYTGSVAAGATPTVCRMGVYSVAADDSIALLTSTANDTTLWSATFNAYPKALTTPFAKVAGQRYAVGLLCVTAATLPQFHGISYGTTTIANTLVSIPPARLNRVTGQADLPASVAAGGFNSDRVAITFRLS